MCGKGDFAMLCLLAACMVTVAIICTVSISSNDWSRLNFRDVGEKGRSELCDVLKGIISYIDPTFADLLTNFCKNFMNILPTNDGSTDGSKSQRYFTVALPWTDWWGSNASMKVGIVCIGLGTAMVWFFAVISLLSLVFNVNKDNLLKRYCFYMLGLSIAFILLFSGLMAVVADRYMWRADQQIHDVRQLCAQLFKLAEVASKGSLNPQKKPPCLPNSELFESIKSMLSGSTNDKPHIGIDVTLMTGFYLCLLADLLLLLPLLLTLVLYICGKRSAKSRARMDANTLDRSRSRSRSPSYGRKKRQQRTDAV